MARLIETGPLATESVIHDRTHQGIAYIISRVNTALANDGSLDIVLLVGANHAHTVFAVNAGGVCEAGVYEQPTLSAQGTVLQVVPRNRATSLPAALKARHSPTVTAVGNALFRVIVPGGGFGFAPVGGSFSGRAELVLKRATNYLFRATNISGGAAPVALNVDFYELP